MNRRHPLVLFGGRNYAKKVLATQPANLLAYWMLDDKSGTAALDSSGNVYNGVISGATLAQPGIGDGRTAFLFDGVNDTIDMFSAGLASVFPNAEGTILWWSKMPTAVWQDASYRVWFKFTIDGNNYVRAYKNAVVDTNDTVFDIKTNGVSKIFQIITGEPTGWMPFAITWSAAGNRYDYYVNGASIKNGTFSSMTGALTAALIGNQTVEYFKGNLAHIALWSAALAQSEIVRLSKAR